MRDFLVVVVLRFTRLILVMLHLFLKHNKNIDALFQEKGGAVVQNVWRGSVAFFPRSLRPHTLVA